MIWPVRLPEPLPPVYCAPDGTADPVAPWPQAAIAGLFVAIAIRIVLAEALLGEAERLVARCLRLPWSQARVAVRTFLDGA